MAERSGLQRQTLLTVPGREAREQPGGEVLPQDLP